MQPRALVALGLLLASIGLLVPGLHHVRCAVTFVGEGSGTIAAPCVETFPFEFAFAAAAVGIVGIVLTLAGAHRARTAGAPRVATRALVALAGVALVLPATLTLVGWAAAGFDIALAQPQPEGGSACHGSGGRTPLWLQTPTCLDMPGLVLPPLFALAGAAAMWAAWRARRVIARAASAFAVGAVVLAVVLAALALELPDLVWLVPFLATALLALVVARAPRSVWDAGAA